MSDRPRPLRPLLLRHPPGGAAGDGRGARPGGSDATAPPLAGELLRAQRQLTLVYELAEQTAGLREPDLIQDTLLQRYGTMLRAGALFFDRDGCCMRCELARTEGRRLDFTADRLRAVLAPRVETTRSVRRALVAPLTADEAAALGGASILLATLPRPDAETGVVIALRAAGDAPFDAGDVLAAESALAYGAQILSNALLMRHMQHAALQTVCALVNAIDAKDNYTSDHSERVGGYARLAGEALGLPRDRLQALEWAGMLHDVGKIGIPEAILCKPGLLTASEMAEVQKHPRIGYDMLRPVAHFEPVLDAILCHHENHDGSGYPEARAGQAVPLDARIIHVVDIFDALTTDRPYRRAYAFGHALRLLEDGAGRVTDPQITRLFIESLQRYRTAEPAAFRARFGHLAAGAAVP